MQCLCTTPASRRHWLLALLHVCSRHRPHFPIHCSHVLILTKDPKHVTSCEVRLHVAFAFVTLTAFSSGWRRCIVIFCTMRTTPLQMLVTAAYVALFLLVLHSVQSSPSVFINVKSYAITTLNAFLKVALISTSLRLVFIRAPMPNLLLASSCRAAAARISSRIFSGL